MSSQKTDISDAQRKQIITSTLQELQKELNHHSYLPPEKQKSAKNKSKIKENRKQEQQNARNLKGKTKGQIVKNILEEKRKELNRNNPEGSKKSIKAKVKRKPTTNNKSKVNKTFMESVNNRSVAQSVQLSEISNHNWTVFKKEIEKHEEHQYNQKVKKCLDKMQNCQMFELHFTSLHFIRKAIVDSLLARKWDNLVKFLVILIKNYSDPVFTIFIKHMCKILKHYHPRIRGTEFEDQIELIMEKYEKMRNSRHSALSSLELNNK